MRTLERNHGVTGRLILRSQLPTIQRSSRSTDSRGPRRDLRLTISADGFRMAQNGRAKDSISGDRRFRKALPWPIGCDPCMIPLTGVQGYVGTVPVPKIEDRGQPHFNTQKWQKPYFSK